MKRNILVAHGGGPTPVMNSSLRGVIEGAREAGNLGKLYAARFGAEGILINDLIDLTDVSASEVERLSFTPASAIGSCRRKLTEADHPAILSCIRENRIDCLLYNGGNDSMDTCLKLSLLAERSNMDLSVMGIPKTIDNDLAVTDHSPGYGSAARYAAVSSAEVGADASALPIHVVVMELMGRNAGWITAAAQLGAASSRCEMMTLLPEQLLDEQSFLAEVEKRFARGRGLLVAVSEGVCGKDGKPLSDTGLRDGFGHTIAGGTAQYLSDLIIQKLKIKSRSEKPGLLGRSSMALVSESDREEAYRVGREAAQAALRSQTGSMVALRAERSPRYRAELFLAPLCEVANAEKKFPLSWIDGWDIGDAFSDYCLPLLGGELPVYAHLR